MSRIDIEVNDDLDFEVGDSVIVVKEDGTIRKVILPEMGVSTNGTAGYKKMLEIIDFIKPGARKEFTTYNKKKLH